MFKYDLLFIIYYLLFIICYLLFVFKHHLYLKNKYYHLFFIIYYRGSASLPRGGFWIMYGKAVHIQNRLLIPFIFIRPYEDKILFIIKHHLYFKNKYYHLLFIIYYLLFIIKHHLYLNNKFYYLLFIIYYLSLDIIYI